MEATIASLVVRINYHLVYELILKIQREGTEGEMGKIVAPMRLDEFLKTEEWDEDNDGFVGHGDQRYLLTPSIQLKSHSLPLFLKSSLPLFLKSSPPLFN